MSLTRADVRMLRERLNKLLAEFGDDCEAQVVGNASFSLNNATFKVEIAPLVDGKAITQEEEDFKRYATSYGLKPEDFNREFQWAGESCVLIGCKPRSTKFPLLVKKANGKIYKFPASTVRLALSQVPA